MELRACCDAGSNISKAAQVEVGVISLICSVHDRVGVGGRASRGVQINKCARLEDRISSEPLNRHTLLILIVEYSENLG